MLKLALDDRTAAVVRARARDLGVSEGEFVRRAILAYVLAGRETPVRDPWAPIPIYGEYDGRRVDGLYLPATRRVTVTSAPLPGAGFKSPSGAARAVVAALNPARSQAQSNGWRFWRLAESGERLEVLR